MEFSSLLFNIPNKGLLSTDTTRLMQPRVNILECCNAHDTAITSLSVGE